MQRRDDRAGVGDEVGARLDLQVRAPRPSRSRKRDQLLRARARRTSARSVDCSPGMRADLEAAAEVDASSTSGSCAARSSVMRVTRFQTSGSVPEPMWLCSRRIVRSWRVGDRLHVGEVLVPDAEARGRAAGVRAVGRAAAEARGSCGRDTLAPGATWPNASSWWSEQALKSTPRADVLARSRRDGICEVSWMRSGGEAGAQRALDLVVARGVDVQAEVAEEREDAAARVRLHRVAQR